MKEEKCFSFLEDTQLLVTWLEWMKQSYYTFRSMQNYILATIQFCSFIKRPLPVDSLLFKIQPPIKRIQNCELWLQSQSKVLAPLASKQTQARNSRESLESRNLWLAFAEVLEIRGKICLDINSLMDGTRQLSMRECSFIRNCIMVLMFTFGLPLRSQNLNVIIWKEKQTVTTATKNTLVLKEETTSFFEMVLYKNSKFIIWFVIKI